MTLLLDKDGNKVLSKTVAIVVPCGDQVAASFAFDLAKLIGFMVAVRPDVRILAYMNKGTIIPEQRHLLVRQAMLENPTHLLWVDSDMRFPKDALLRMLAHEQKVVACNYATRRQPCIPTAGTGPDDELLYPADDETELIPVSRCGMGLMLVDADVYRTVPAPWFALGFNKAQDSYAGEDVFFCGLMQRNGIAVNVDPVLSRELKHCGEFEYGLIHADLTKAKFLDIQRMEREAAVAEQPSGAE